VDIFNIGEGRNQKTDFGLQVIFAIYLLLTLLEEYFTGKLGRGSHPPHQNQSEIVMDLNFYQFAELIDIKPDANSHFIHSMSEPFSEEDIEDEVMHNWLNHFDMNFYQLHASGHMNREQLVERINIIKPKKVFPIHTENPNLFSKTCPNVQRIKRGKNYVL
jgi:hypothetical protein